MNILFLKFLALVSCAKPGVNLSDIKKELKGPSCMQTVKQQLLNHGCEKLQYKSYGEYDIAFRCHKPDEKKSEFWDTYIFRISPAEIKYSPKDQILIDHHTLCIEDGVRIEAYPPEKAKQ
jgi:hypothetical protein